MKASTIYRRAAEELQGSTSSYFFGCALDDAGQPFPGGDKSPLQDSFTDLFLGIDSYWHGKQSEEKISVQQLALLLMAEIVAEHE